MPSLRLPVSIRPMTPGDAAIVYHSWASSMADELDIKEPTARKAFIRSHKPIIDALLARSETLVANPRGDTENVLGWICLERPDILHFIFVKKDFRLGGIAWQLLRQAKMPPEARASHATSWGFPRVAKLFAQLTHNPELGIP